MIAKARASIARLPCQLGLSSAVTGAGSLACQTGCAACHELAAPLRDRLYGRLSAVQPAGDHRLADRQGRSDSQGSTDARGAPRQPSGKPGFEQVTKETPGYATAAHDLI